MAPRINPDSGLIRNNSALTRAPLRATRQISNPSVTDNNAGQDAAQIARALAEVAPRLGRLSDQMAVENQKQDVAAGQQFARDLAASGKSFADAIRTGKITASQSPWYRYGAEEQFGRVSAARFGDALHNAITTGPLADSTNPEDFNGFLSQFRDKWLKDNVGQTRSQAFEVGFADSDQQVESAQRTFSAIAGKNLETQVNENAYELQRRIIDTNLSDRQALVTQIQQANAERYALNPNSGREINRTTVKAVIDAARKAGDPSLLGVLDQLTAGNSGAKLSNISEFADQIADADVRIRSERQARYSFDARQAKAERETAVSQVYTDLTDALEQAGDGVAELDMTPFIQRFSDLNEGESAQKLYRMRDAYAKRVDINEEDGIVHDLYVRAGKGLLTTDALTDALANGSIKPKTFKDLLGLVGKTRSRGEGNPLAVFSERPLSIGVTSLKAKFGAEYGYNNAELSIRASAAADALQTEYIKYREGEGANASPADINQWMSDKEAELFVKYAQGTDITLDYRTLSQDKPTASTGTKPKTTPGPKPVDWHKDSVLSPAEFADLQGQLVTARNGSGQLPGSFIAKLRSYGVSPQEVTEFFVTQGRLLSQQ